MRYPHLACVFTFFLSACGGGSGGSDNSANPASPPVNQAPVIAATSQTVLEGQQVTVSATVTDVDGSVSEYEWSQVSGPAISFVQPNAPSLSFMAPAVEKTTQVKLELAVKDDEGAQSKSAITVTININNPPLVTVEDQRVTEQSAVVIEAVASDLDGSIVSYVWEQLSGPQVLDLVPQGSSLSFTTPDIEEPQTALFKVTVFDNLGKYSEHTFSVEIEIFAFNFAISGVASEGVTPQAEINLKIGSQQFNTISDAQGKYNFALNLDETMATEMVTVEAKDATDNTIVLTAILGDVAAIYAASGSDKVLTYEELSSVNINYLSTTLAVLLEQSQGEGGIQNQIQFIAALDDFDGERFAEIMTAIKLVVEFGHSDANLSLPAEVSDTLQFVQDRALLTAYLKQVINTNSEIYQSAKNALFSGFNSVPMTEESIIGTRFLSHRALGQNTGFVSSNTGRLTFNQDLSGTLVDKFGEIPFTWSVVNQTVQISMAEELLVEEDEWCESSLLSNGYVICETYIVGLDLYFLKVIEGKTLVVVNREKRHEDSILQAEYVLAGFGSADDIVDPQSIISFDETYILPLYSRTDLSAPQTGEFSENLNAGNVRFLAGSEQNGVTEVDYPITDINGLTEYQTRFGTWTFEANNTLTLDVPDIEQLNPLNIAFTSGNSDSHHVNLLAAGDSGLRSISARGFVKKADAVNWNSNSVIGIYWWGQEYLSPLRLSWIEFYESGESLSVSIRDSNDDGLVSDEEFRLRHGRWQINSDGNLVNREYKDLEQGFRSSHYCRSETFQNIEGDNCIVARENLWEILQSDNSQTNSTQITYRGVLKTYNEAYRRSGEPYSGVDILEQHHVIGHVMYKISERPMALPQQ